MIKNKLINRMTENDSKEIFKDILNKEYTSFSKAKKIIKNLGDKELNEEISNLLISKGYNKNIENEYLSKGY